MTDKTTILERIAKIKEELWKQQGNQRRINNVHGSLQSTISILKVIYGDPSPQLQRFLERSKFGASGDDMAENPYQLRLALDIENILDSTIGDLEAGLTTSISVSAKGEVLGDFIGLAREALAQQTSDSEKVAAALSAASLEETLKQIGENHGVEVYNRDIRGVIQKLKDAGVLTGAQPGVALGFAKFRDAAFHGQFDQITKATAESALAFVEGLLRDFS